MRIALFSAINRPRLFKERITLSPRYITIQWIVYFVFLSFIHWIVIYPVDSVVHPLNNRALVWGKVSFLRRYNAKEEDKFRPPTFTSIVRWAKWRGTGGWKTGRNGGRKCRGCRKRGGRRGIPKVAILGDPGADRGARESRKGRKKSGRKKVPKSGRNRNQITQNCVIFLHSKRGKRAETRT